MAWKIALRLNENATLFDLDYQKGQVEVERPPHRKLF